VTNKDEERDEADFSGPEDRIEFEARMKREVKADSFDSVPHEKTFSWIDKTLGSVANVLLFLSILIAVVIGGYMIYVWWGVIKNLGFLEFSISLVLFLITIPVAPIYVGIDGDWGPAIYVALGVFFVVLFFRAAMWCLVEIKTPS
jgi:hypothetical protein